MGEWVRLKSSSIWHLITPILPSTLDMAPLTLQNNMCERIESRSDRVVRCEFNP